MNPIESEDNFRDDALRRALESAPDHAVAPDWRIRKAIQQQAWQAVQPESPELKLGVPWWKRLLGSARVDRPRGNRMPWNAAFATVLVAGLVTVIWQREQIPGARLDSDDRIAADAPPPLPKPAETPAPEQAESEKSASTAPALTPAPAQPPEHKAEAESATRDVAAAPVAPPSAAVVQPPPPVAPPPAAELALPVPTAQASKKSRLELSGDLSDLAPPTPTTSTPPRASAKPAPSVETVAPSAPASPATPPAVASNAIGGLAAPSASALARQPVAPSGRIAADSAAPPALRVAPAPKVAVAAPTQTHRTEATEPPTFSALSQWTRLTIAENGGPTRTVSRAEVRELAPLMGSAAISAVTGQPFRGTAQWRLTLERDNKVLAVLELTGDQVRWREGSSLPATGSPPPGALGTLRAALVEAGVPPPSDATPAMSPVLPMPAAPPDSPEPESGR